jgi:hypothetical protein
MPDPSELPDGLPEQGENPIPEEMPSPDPGADPPTGSSDEAAQEYQEG